MSLSPKQKSLILFGFSQVPMALLLLIFFRIPELPLKYRAVAIVTILLEAALLYELIGNIVQKVRVHDHFIIIRKVFERQRIPWKEVKGLRQVVVSPMRKASGSARYPVKLFLVKVKGETKPQLESAQDWWVRKGPLANRRSSLFDLVKRYDSFVHKSLLDWYVLWRIEYRQPQQADEDVSVKYLFLDGREAAMANDFLAKQQHKASSLRKVEDLTYPMYVRRHGGKYADDVKHVWETLES